MAARIHFLGGPLEGETRDVDHVPSAYTELLPLAGTVDGAGPGDHVRRVTYFYDHDVRPPSGEHRIYQADPYGLALQLLVYRVAANELVLYEEA